MVYASANKLVCPNASDGGLEEGLTSHVAADVKNGDRLVRGRLGPLSHFKHLLSINN
jgi:hypothetical protein